MSFIKWLFKGIDKSILLSGIAIIFAICDIVALLLRIENMAKIFTGIGILAVFFLIKEVYQQYRKEVRNERN